MKRNLAILAGVSLGTGLMYWLDPARGRRRRARSGDQLKHLMNETERGFGAGFRDFTHRTSGSIARARQRILPDHPEDEVLTARVRAKMGHSITHPHAIDVSAKKGEVTLRGVILEEEVYTLLSAVSGIPGVKMIHNELEAHKESEDFPGLLGGFAPAARRKWTPSVRLAIGMAATGGVLLGLRRRDALGAVVCALSLGALIRAVSGHETKSWIGLGREGAAVQVLKSITISAPRERIFDFLSRPESFTEIMPDIREVRNLGENRYRWTVLGPAGLPFRWDTSVTQLEQNEVLAWRSEPGSIVQNAGRVRFHPNIDGSTRVEIEINYTPPAGALGHFVAKLFGADPKSKLDEDLMRLKSTLEGHPPRPVH